MPPAWKQKHDTHLVAHDHEVLRSPAQPVTDLAAAAKIAKHMHKVCKARGGVAIAAPQIGEPLQLIVLASGLAIVNPSMQIGGEIIEEPEQCLSLPGCTFAVKRRKHALLVGLGVDGKSFVSDVEGHQARILQHEMDHLQGQLIDRFSQLV